MTKSKTKTKTKAAAARKGTALPLPPVIYINDGVSNDTPYYVFPFYKLLPKFSYAAITSPPKKDAINKLLDATKSDSAIALFISTRPSASTHVKEALEAIKKASIAAGRKFLSINFHPATASAPSDAFGTHHLNFAVQNHSFDTAAKDVLKWMFATLAPMDTVHLIPASDFLATDTTNFPDYAYCPISASRSRPKDAKIQFVAVITAKPVLAPEGNKLTWSVADKTGVANFYFIHRGTGSSYTWDWVLKLQPGQRVALPRMPCVEVKEGLGKKVVKAPFRAVGLGLMVPGMVLVGVGKGLQHVGEKVSLGKSSKWVAKADVIKDGKGVVRERKTGEEVQREWEEKRLSGESKDSEGWSVFDEKGRLAWDSDDEDAKTEKGSVLGVDDEKRV